MKFITNPSQVQRPPFFFFIVNLMHTVRTESSIYACSVFLCSVMACKTGLVTCAEAEGVRRKSMVGPLGELNTIFHTFFSYMLPEERCKKPEKTPRCKNKLQAPFSPCRL